MVSVDQLLASALASFIVIVIPSPSVLFAIGRALAHGRRTALAAVFGTAVGFEVVAVRVALGIGTVVERSAVLFTAVKLAGAAPGAWGPAPCGPGSPAHPDDWSSPTALVAWP